MNPLDMLCFSCPSLSFFSLLCTFFPLSYLTERLEDGFRERIVRIDMFTLIRTSGTHLGNGESFIK